MTEFVIDRITATTSAPEEARVRRLLAGLVERRLDAALSRRELPPGEWCIRRVDVWADLDFDRADASLEEQWADLLARAVKGALTGSSAQGGAPAGFGGFGSVLGGWRESRVGEVVHYRRREDAVADLFGSLAVGSSERLWAWRQLGLLSSADPADPAPAILAVLRRQPTAAMPALLAALDSAGLAALHRLLTSSGWTELATIVLTAAGFPAAAMAAAKPAESLAPSSADGPPAGSGSGPGSVAGMRLAAKIGERSRLAAAFRRARFLIDPGTVRAWAVLAAAETEPALFARAEAGAVLARLTEAVAVGTGSRARAAIAARPPRPSHADRAPDRGSAWSPPPAAEPTPSPAGEPDARAPAGRAPGADAPEPAIVPSGHDRTRQQAGSRREPTRPAGVMLDQPATGEWPTRWGGLLFLLATADQAGIPREVLADDAFADRLLSWVLFHLGTLLVPAGQAGVPDPAMFALAGLLPADRPAAPAPTGAQRSRLGEHARRWAHATATRLRPGGADDPFAAVARVAARDGIVAAAPGWCEIHLPLASVDIDVRRAGLDVDPGWVPWLGSVVMFRYA